MTKPTDMLGRMEVATGFCPGCHKPYRHTNYAEQRVSLRDVPTPSCRGNGHEYECNKDKRNEHRRTPG